MQLLNLQQFESIMEKQEGQIITLSHYGSFNHRNIYKKFKLENNVFEYKFVELDVKNDDCDCELMINTLLKENIVNITYLDFSNQVELELKDASKLIFDLELSDDFEIE